MDRILEAYDEQVVLYTDFTEKLRHMLEEILDEYCIRTHSISARVKERNTLEQKLLRKGKKYHSLEDVTDVSGIRIITYYSEDVDRIAEIIEHELKVDHENSIDKRKLLDQNEFGYLSLHFVVSFPEERAQLTEYRRFEGLKAEIQIRSILQHTWAEIEHDLYKKAKEETIPFELRRKFSRIAGLLEIADNEFSAIRKQIKKRKKDNS